MYYLAEKQLMDDIETILMEDYGYSQSDIKREIPKGPYRLYNVLRLAAAELKKESKPDPTVEAPENVYTNEGYYPTTFIDRDKIEKAMQLVRNIVKNRRVK